MQDGDAPKSNIMKKSLSLAFVSIVSLHAFAQDSTSKPLYVEESLKVLPVLYMQTAAEYRALCYQAYNTAKYQMEEMLEHNKRKARREHWAIVTDLDETILDNSYEEARLIKANRDWNTKDWNYWVGQANATEVPGAGDFLRWAHNKGITIFYISNRDTSQVMSTMLNLQKLNLPDADTAHMLFLTNTSSKEARRQIVMTQHNIKMLMGDNLNDFMAVFEKKDIAARKAETDNQRDNWGVRFIVLPNAYYGEWENALYQYKRGLKPTERDAMRKELLKD